MYQSKRRPGCIQLINDNLNIDTTKLNTVITTNTAVVLSSGRSWNYCIWVYITTCYYKVCAHERSLEGLRFCSGNSSTSYVRYYILWSEHLRYHPVCNLLAISVVFCCVEPVMTTFMITVVVENHITCFFWGDFL